MVELSGSWLYQQHSPWESSVFRNFMVDPVEHRQHESLPASINPFWVSTSSGLNGYGCSGLPKTGLPIEGDGSMQRPVLHFQNPLAQNECHNEQNPLLSARVGEKPSTCELPSAEKKRFLIFDRSGTETRLIFSSLCPRVQNLSTPQTTCPAVNVPKESLGGAYHHYLIEKQGRITEQTWSRTPALYEESGENEIINEVSEMREDTEEINALLYSEDEGDGDDDNDNGLYDDCDCEDDDEVSSGHSPLAKERDFVKQEEQDDKKDLEDEVASLERSSKRQKALDGGHNKLPQIPAYEYVNDGHFISALKEGVCPVVGSKRLRQDNIHDTLKVLEGIIPGLKSKDPLVILDEAISYLKCLKYNAETMSSEDPDSCSSYEPLN